MCVSDGALCCGKASAATRSLLSSPEVFPLLTEQHRRNPSLIFVTDAADVRDVGASMSWRSRRSHDGGEGFGLLYASKALSTA